MLHLAFRVLGCAGVAREAEWGRGIEKRRFGYTDMRRVTTTIRYEKCVGRRFRRCVNVYLHKPSTVQYSPLHT
jgi:hypothetical protein